MGQVVEGEIAVGDRRGHHERSRLDAVGDDGPVDALELADAFDGDAGPAPVIHAADMALSMLARSATSGSHAADSMMVTPLAKAAADITLAVPSTVEPKGPPRKMVSAQSAGGTRAMMSPAVRVICHEGGEPPRRWRSTGRSPIAHPRASRLGRSRRLGEHGAEGADARPHGSDDVVASVTCEGSVVRREITPPGMAVSSGGLSTRWPPSCRRSLTMLRTSAREGHRTG